MRALAGAFRSISLAPMFSRLFLCAALLISVFPILLRLWRATLFNEGVSQAPPHFQATIAKCMSLQQEPRPPPDFWKRSRSDRYEAGTRPVLIKQGRIWTGRNNGTQVIYGDILMEKGIIKSVGNLGWLDLTTYGSDLQVVDVNGAWISPGLVDVHSHIGEVPLPFLEGSNDADSLNSIAQPWLRSLDALKTHDETYPLTLAGGVTTALVLPGSADAIGGQAFVIKLRETSEKSSSSMLVEPPYHINSTHPDPNLPFRWRHMKHACGENPSRSFQGTRMDTIWAFREAYAKAQSIKEKQDKFCSSVLSGNQPVGPFPEELQWEALVDVLRGRVKVHTHCYETVDIDDFVRLTNEFKFPVAAFHHASEAYLVPDVLKRAYGETPAVALYECARFKREAYRSSEFAPRVLAHHGITVLMKSDHPAAVDSRHLIYEAQRAYFYGLPYNLAMASVISNAAEVLGLGHRLGYIQEGWDADIVVWDSHPLALGATPTQVYIDGAPQLRGSIKVEKPANFQKLPRVPKFDQEAAEAVRHDGLPPLEPRKKILGTTVFTNVKSLYIPGARGIQRQVITQEAGFGVVVVQNGRIVCTGDHHSCFVESLSKNRDVAVVNLDGGSVSPGFVSYGSNLGLEDILLEPSTNDGLVPDPHLQRVPKILGGDSILVRAADGLQFGTRHALLAYRSGVTSAVVAPVHRTFTGGLGVFFSLGALNKMEKNAVIQEVTGLHVSIGHFSRPSVSTQIATLRRLLLRPATGMMGAFFHKVKQGSIPLVVEAHNADIIATLLILKSEYEMEEGRSLRLTISGATEAHFLAKELAEAGVGVILAPLKPLPMTWEKRRIVPGPPITKETALSILLKHGVTVGIGSETAWSARNLPFELAWAAIEAGGIISKEEVLSMGSTNIERLLGVVRDPGTIDLVATKGGDLLDFGAEVVAIISPAQESVNLLRDV